MNCNRCGKEIIGCSLFVKDCRVCVECFLKAEKELGVDEK